MRDPRPRTLALCTHAREAFYMLKNIGLLVSVACIAFPSLAYAAPAVWTVRAPAQRAQISGGPWVLAQGGGDAATPPAGGWPTPNPGTNNFQPYYQSYVAGTADKMQ